MKENETTKEVFIESLWRYFPKEASFIKSTCEPNSRMGHIVLDYSLGFVNWYKAGLWGFNRDCHTAPICNFEDSAFMEEIVTKAESRKEGGGMSIVSAHISFYDKEVLNKIHRKMGREEIKKGIHA